MTAEDLSSLLARLRHALDTEEFVDEFSCLEEDYYVTARALAREAIVGLDVTEPADRERFLVAKEVYDLCDDIHRARWRKVHALAVRLVGADPIEALPDNLLAAERDYLNSVIRIREIREQG